MTDRTSHIEDKQAGALFRIFGEHPASVNETYLQHMRFALWFCAQFAMAASAALVHAFIPAFCKTTASRILQNINAKIEARH